MALIYNHGDSVEFDRTSIAIGTFDGVHIAHTNIINKAREIAGSENIKSGVLTFDKIPANVVSDVCIPQLINLNDRIEMFRELDFVYVEEFNEEFMNLSPEEFVRYLKSKLKAVAVSVGYNFRFGRGASADASLLKSLCKELNIDVYICDKNEVDGQAVSSTRIRNLLSGGFVEEASKLLGRPFYISGTVVHGKQNGKKMGVPTANIMPDSRIVQLKDGVYAGICIIDGASYKSVVNVGNNPTFNGVLTTIECHILNFSGDVYDKNITVQFVRRIRDEVCFNSPSALAQQIARDIEVAKSI